MNRTIRSLITALTLAIAIGVFVVEMVAGQLPPYVGPADLRTTRTLEVPCAPSLVMETGDGAVRVTPRRDASAETCSIVADIRLYRTGEGSDQIDLRDLSSQLAAIDSTATRLHIRSVPEGWPADVAAIVAYDVEVPAGADVEVHGVNGNVWVAKGCREVHVESGNADVAIYEPAGNVLARSTNGRLRLVGGRNPSTLETVNGNIRAEMLEGKLTAVSVNGNVHADMIRPTVAAAVLRSENGDVAIDLPSDSGFTLDAAAERGRVVGDDIVDGWATGGGAYRGSTGSGEMRLTLHSANGSIKLSRK